jgi:hypothetical protein
MKVCEAGSLRTFMTTNLFKPTLAKKLLLDSAIGYAYLHAIVSAKGEVHNRM